MVTGGRPLIPAAATIRCQLQVRGVVQGVGFRPWIYNLAVRHALGGFVLNAARGVFIEIEGPPHAVEAFLAAMRSEAPPLVRIAEILRTDLPPTGESVFAIRESDSAGSAFALVPPDICVCDRCLADTRDPANRRHDYPFTNCTNCGPRYSIIRDVPYDRPLTTMAEFAMCNNCRHEYENPSDRRFHAQPNACPVCGPQLILHIPGDSQPEHPGAPPLSAGQGGIPPSHPRLPRRNRRGAPHLPEVGRCGKAQASPLPYPGAPPLSAGQGGSRAILTRVADLLLAGRIVAWKGLGGYQLACDATNPSAVEELRRRKRRSEKPFAIMVADANVAAALCFVSGQEHAALASPERPIVLLRRRPGSPLADAVSPGNPATGVMLPCTPMHDLLFRILRERQGREAAPIALVMTSGNVSEEPIVIGNAEAELRLAGIADAFAHHNRPIHTRVDDSVVRIVSGSPMLLRRARGYTPMPVFLGRGESEVLAVGAQQKNTLCLTRAGFALPSQHLGDLENFETLRFFEETLQRMSRLFHVRPTAVAHDLHPGYLSTQLALKMDIPAIPVQHHHAHIASCMAEHQLTGEVIGVAWDGTGLGSAPAPATTIWGGEFLVASYTAFTRHARLRPVLLPGGDSAVREPWRVARSYLCDTFPAAPSSSAADRAENPGAPPLSAGQGGRILRTWESKIPPSRLRVIDTMLQRRLNTIPTSSAGRLFDAVASLIGLRHTVSFEGQAAMLLEAAAQEFSSDPAAIAGLPPYDFSLAATDSLDATSVSSVPSVVTSPPLHDLDLRPMILDILEDVARGESRSRIAARFHATLIAAIAHVCRHIRSATGLDRVCLSGGCFQNAILLEGSLHALQADGFQVFTHREIPANDGGISLGQAAIACEILSAEQAGN